MSTECVSLGVTFISMSFHLWFQAISKYLPRGDLRLKPAIYEMILYEFLKTDYEVQLRFSPLVVLKKKRKNNSLSHFL